MDHMTARELRENADEVAGHEAADTDDMVAEPECEGHPAGPFDPMGETVYCDGSCHAGR